MHLITPSLKAATAVLAVFVTCPFFVVAAPASTAQNLVVHEKRNLDHDFVQDAEDSGHWIKRSRVSRAQVLPMRIALRERNLENAEAYIMDVSSPDSANFGILVNESQTSCTRV